MMWPDLRYRKPAIFINILYIRNFDCPSQPRLRIQATNRVLRKRKALAYNERSTMRKAQLATEETNLSLCRDATRNIPVIAEDRQNEA